jgi:hypothetical protein
MSMSMSMCMRMSVSTRTAIGGDEWQNLLVPLRHAG